jgi:protein-disulfide isomerase
MKGGERRVKPLLIRRKAILLCVVIFAAMSGASARQQAKTPADPAAKSATKPSALTKAKTPATAAANPPGAPLGTKTLGSKSAPITMEVFEDFQCPACGNFYETSLKQVIDNYVNTGKVYLIHRDFPLDIHPYARQAARLANAAADLGQFETVERALFDSQGQWSTNGKIEETIASSVSAAQLKKIRDYEAAHLDAINASIERDRAMGLQRNVNQTPTIYITSHGKTEGLPGGGVDYKLLQKYLDYLLRQ